MDRWTSVPVLLRDVRLGVIRIASVMIALALLAGDRASAFGVAIGAVLSLWQFGHIAKCVTRLVQQARETGQARASLGYVGRYLIVAAVLATVYFTPEVNFAATILGLFLVKIFIVACAVRQVLRDGGAAQLRQLMQERRRREGERYG